MAERLPLERRICIDNEVALLAPYGGNDKKKRYQEIARKLAQERGIRVIKSSEIIAPACQSIWVGTRWKHYVFMPTPLSPSVEEYFLAHEYGHILLGHTTFKDKKNLPQEVKEEEAIYFAEKLLQQPRPTTEEIRASIQLVKGNNSCFWQQYRSLPKGERLHIIEERRELSQIVHILNYMLKTEESEERTINHQP